MKILFVSRLFDPHIGGVEKHVEKVAEKLIAQGFSVTVLTTQYTGSLTLTDEYQQIKIIRIPREKVKSKWKTWWWVYRNREFFNQFDLVHIHDVFWMLLPLVIFRFAKPLYITFHGWEGKFPPSLKAKWWRQLAVRCTKGSIAVGEFIQKWYEINPTVITYGGTDQQPLLPGDKDRIVVLGRISHDNDAPMVVESLTRLKQAFPHVKIRFLGDGDYAFEAEKIGKVLGFKKDISEQLQLAKTVIASSYLSMTDAIASGRHVFSFYSNQLKKDYLTTYPGAQYISRVISPDQFVTEFATMYNNKETSNEQIIKGQAWAQTQTWDKIAQVYLDLWTKDNVIVAQERLDSITESE